MVQLKINMVILLFQKTFRLIEKKCSKELSDHVDFMLIKAESAVYVDEALIGLNSEKVTHTNTVAFEA